MAENPHGDDVAFIKALAELLRENELSELQVKRDFGDDGSLSVRVSRSTTAAPAAPAVFSAPEITRSEPKSEYNVAPDAPEDPAAHPGAVTSPMVGTVYLQPEPGMPAFVSLGNQVAEGQVLLIVEAMKTMNHIHAPHAGTVKRILVEDGSPVEYGAPLMIVD